MDAPTPSIANTDTANYQTVTVSFSGADAPDIDIRSPAQNVVVDGGMAINYFDAKVIEQFWQGRD